MLEKNEELTTVIRRKMGVFGNKQVTIPIDVIDAWGNKIPKSVYFTIKKKDSQVIVTIEPEEEQPTITTP